MTRTADIVIIGGGVMGTSIAYHLAVRRAGRVVLLEKGDLAVGTGCCPLPGEPISGTIPH